MPGCADPEKVLKMAMALLLGILVDSAPRTMVLAANSVSPARSGARDPDLLQALLVHSPVSPFILRSSIRDYIAESLSSEEEEESLTEPEVGDPTLLLSRRLDRPPFTCVQTACACQLLGSLRDNGSSHLLC